MLQKTKNIHDTAHGSMRVLRQQMRAIYSHLALACTALEIILGDGLFRVILYKF